MKGWSSSPWNVPMFVHSCKKVFGVNNKLVNNINYKKHPQNEKYKAMPTSWQYPPWASGLILHILRLLTGISPNRASCSLTSSFLHLDVGYYSRLLLSPADLDHPEHHLHPPVKTCAYFWGAWQLSKELLPFARKIYLQSFSYQE